MAYYKTNNPEALKGLEDYVAGQRELHDKADAFCAQFGGTSGVYRSIDRVYFRGIHLKDPDRNIWAELERGQTLYRPRAKPKVKEATEAWKAIKSVWDTGVKELVEVPIELIYKPIGLGNSLFFGRFSCVKSGDWLYIDTDQKVAEHCIEILGSEYQEAEKNAKKA